MSKPVLNDLRRLVIKIGSTLLVDEQNQLDRNWLDNLADDIDVLRKSGHQVLIVSSGAVAIGSHVLGINPRRSRLEELQAAAAAGQVQLVHAYQDALSRHDIRAAQILLTPDDTEVKRRFLNARGTLEKLLDHDVVPVINENDTVATDELRYGDNDRLAARVAQTVMADCLILLSDVDGFYTADPRANPGAEYLEIVESISDEHMLMAGNSGSALGSGGMNTKLQAARIATHAGCATIIASGVVDRPLHALFNGARHTVFPAAASPAAARKQWLAGVLEVSGELRLDAGAAAALLSGNSLLPVGLVEVVGQFRRGDAVMLVGHDGAELGRGLAAYSNKEADAIKGCRSDQIEEILGYRGRSVMVHRDDMVLFDRT
jgi:glutamate 5-kinase